jgi:hypothetical protein
MKRKYMPIAAVTLILITLSLIPAYAATTLANEQFSLDSTDILTSYKDLRFYLSKGDRVSINVSVTSGSLSLFGLYNSTETYDAILLEKRDTTSVYEEWTAPYNDTFDFYFKVYTGAADVQFILIQVATGGQGGGIDPMLIAVVVIVVVIVLAAALLFLRLRKRPVALPPPPPPPPPA